MKWTQIIWDYEPGGNVDHIANNGLTPAEVTYVLQHPTASAVSRSSGYPMLFGYTGVAEYVAVVYEEVDGDTIRPITAYMLEDDDGT